MKQKIALVAGGYSGEYVISIKSSSTIENNIDRNKYDVYKIFITKEGWWHETADGLKINVDKNDFSLAIDGAKITFDLVFIGIHGTPGEDGKLQGYLDMIGVPYTTCNSIVSALTFNKSFCNKVLKASNIVSISNSLVLHKHTPYSLGVILEHIKLPAFVKPNESGSSLGVSKVVTLEQLIPAIEKSFKEDNQVLVEEFIEGRELTMGVYRTGTQIETLPPTEIISKNDFFDYEAKYTTGVTDEITPAKISSILLEEMQKKSKAIYAALNCSGMVRIDYILNKHDKELYFLEVNTMPGQSENSLIPQQVRAAGMTLPDFYQIIITEALKK